MTVGPSSRAFGPVRGAPWQPHHRRMAMQPDVVDLDRPECLKLLAQAVVGRIVFTDGALPAVVPITFALDGEQAVCRTSASSRLARAADRGVLALQTDHVDMSTRSGWSVVGTGVAEVRRDAAELDRVAALVDPWVSGPFDAVIRLPLTVLTGRRILPAIAEAPRTA